MFQMGGLSVQPLELAFFYNAIAFGIGVEGEFFKGKFTAYLEIAELDRFVSEMTLLMEYKQGQAVMNFMSNRWLAIDANEQPGRYKVRFNFYHRGSGVRHGMNYLMQDSHDVDAAVLPKFLNGCRDLLRLYREKYRQKSQDPYGIRTSVELCEFPHGYPVVSPYE